MDPRDIWTAFLFVTYKVFPFFVDRGPKLPPNCMIQCQTRLRVWWYTMVLQGAQSSASCTPPRPRATQIQRLPRGCGTVRKLMEQWNPTHVLGTGFKLEGSGWPATLRCSFRGEVHEGFVNLIYGCIQFIQSNCLSFRPTSPQWSAPQCSVG